MTQIRFGHPYRLTITMFSWIFAYVVVFCILPLFRGANASPVAIPPILDGAPGGAAYWPAGGVNDFHGGQIVGPQVVIKELPGLVGHDHKALKVEGDMGYIMVKPIGVGSYDITHMKTADDQPTSEVCSVLFKPYDGIN